MSMIRDQIADTLSWHDAHATFDDAVDGLAPELRGKRAPGFPHSAWELVEHLRITQHDLLEFCRSRSYRTLTWPDDYWPTSASPPGSNAWDASIAAYREDRTALQALIRDPAIALEDRVPNGDGQTYAREALLALDHAAYHVGQLVAVRIALGAWE